MKVDGCQVAKTLPYSYYSAFSPQRRAKLALKFGMYFLGSTSLGNYGCKIAKQRPIEKRIAVLDSSLSFASNSTLDYLILAIKPRIECRLVSVSAKICYARPQSPIPLLLCGFRVPHIEIIPPGACNTRLYLLKGFCHILPSVSSSHASNMTSTPSTKLSIVLYPSPQARLLRNAIVRAGWRAWFPTTLPSLPCSACSL